MAAAIRPCAEPGCPHLVRGASRCADHQLHYPDTRQRPTAHQRGYTTSWQRLVRRAIAQFPACAICGTDADLTGDHIVPLSRGGTSTWENIRILCRRCNSRKGNR